MGYCGIDIASESSVLCVMDEAGGICCEREFPTGEEGFCAGLRGWEGLRCVLEASPLAEWAAVVLEDLGHEVVVIDPRKAKGVICTKNETDRLDARNLARMARTGWYTQVHRKSGSARLLRSRLQARRGLVDTAMAMHSRIRGLLRAHGIKLGKVSEGQFVERVREEVEQREPGLWEVLEPLLAMWSRSMSAAEQMRKSLKVDARCDATCHRLTSVPGVGPVVASVYVATIDDPTRFARGDQVAAYLGLVPAVHQSGESEYRGRITKEGDGLLRWLLVEAAHVLLTRTKRSCGLKRWGLRLAKKKGLGKAKVAVARKLAMILHRIWLTGEPFDWARA